MYKRQVTKTPDGFHLTVNGYGLAEGRVTDCLILSAPFQLVDWSMQNCAMAWVCLLYTSRCV